MLKFGLIAGEINVDYFLAEIQLAIQCCFAFVRSTQILVLLLSTDQSRSRILARKTWHVIHVTSRL